MKQVFKRIILYARLHRANQNVKETLDRLIPFLHDLSLEVLQETETAACFSLPIPTIPLEEMSPDHDLIVVVGGDGSLLSAGRMAVRVNVPVIGINRGRLGFLTDISPKTIEEELKEVLSGHYYEEKRFLLHMRVHNGSHSFFEANAVNDVVLSRGNETHLVEFDVMINQQFVSHYRADGLIVSTPTGSTAYALSAGGPILHPLLNAMVMVPMFSHSLSSRPLVFPAKAEVCLLISEHNETHLQISCDGQESSFVDPGQKVTIEKHDKYLRLLHPKHYHYYDTLRIKLGWGF